VETTVNSKKTANKLNYLTRENKRFHADIESSYKNSKRYFHFSTQLSLNMTLSGFLFYKQLAGKDWRALTTSMLFVLNNFMKNANRHCSADKILNRMALSPKRCKLEP